MSNRNTVWASVFVAALARHGLQAVCIAPGSRSTPLTLAFARNQDITVYSHLDERSAAFFALGLALASERPVALVCTSGTAAANFYPAIIEAHQSRLPLLVLTADRPPELRYSGANQTIDQVKMYGDFVLWSVEAALPEANPPDIALRNLRTLAARALAKANGLRKGVVHINMPFRKPLEPTPMEGDRLTVPAARHTRIEAAPPAYNSAGVEHLHTLFRQHRRGVILCGPGWQPGNATGEALAAFARQVGYPIVADPLSQMRFHPAVSTVGSYDSAPLPEQPEIILRFGNVPTSKALNAYISGSVPAHYLHFSADGEWSDDAHLVTETLALDERAFLRDFAERDYGVVDSTWMESFTRANETTWKVIEREVGGGAYFDGAAVYDVVDLIPDGSSLFVGNSLPVRHLDQFGKPTAKRLRVYANRGTSGIDGNISTALGIGAAHPDRPLVAIVGDVTFYHDMNGLLAVRRCGVPVTIVLLNNNGGGIFHRLPVRDYDPEFSDLFLTPHGLEFEPAIRMYGLDYVRADDRASFRQAFRDSVTHRTSCVVEVRSDAREDDRRRREIMTAVQAASAST